MRHPQNFRAWCRRGLAAGLVLFALVPSAGAYLASGDRVFVPTVVLPQQIAPGNDLYIWGSNQPIAGDGKLTEFNGTFAKEITERLGIVVDDIWTRSHVPGNGAQYGWLNLDAEVKYLAVDDQPHEFLLTVGLDHEFGGTGAARAGASHFSANTPRLYFGKGLGDFDIGYLRPLAIRGLVGYQFSDSAPRPDLVQAGAVIEYSIPYLESKVQSLNLPEPFRRMTPITEIYFTMPGGQSFGARTTGLICPGVSYAGDGWDFLVEALVPVSKATAAGTGVVAQLHLSFDFLFAGTPLGQPLFPGR